MNWRRSAVSTTMAALPVKLVKYRMFGSEVTTNASKDCEAQTSLTSSCRQLKASLGACDIGGAPAGRKRILSARVRGTLRPAIRIDALRQPTVAAHAAGGPQSVSLVDHERRGTQRSGRRRSPVVRLASLPERPCCRIGHG